MDKKKRRRGIVPGAAYGFLKRIEQRIELQSKRVEVKLKQATTKHNIENS